MKRSGFLVGSATLAAAGAAAPAAAQGVPGGTQLVERKANFDEAAFKAVVGRGADIRQLFEAVAFQPGMLSNVKNSLNGLHFGYGYPADRIAIVIAGHGPSTAYTLSDYVWSKYRIGEFFSIKDEQGDVVAENRWLAAKSAGDPSSDPDDERSSFQDTQIQTLQKRGVVFLTCHTAVEEQSRALVKKGLAPAGMTPTQVADDILTHLIPGAIVVPSMIGTVAVLQAQYQYTYAALTF